VSRRDGGGSTGALVGAAERGKSSFVPDAHRCPICRRPIPPAERETPWRPFCSARCKTVDLGGWLSGAYRISRPVGEEDLDGGLPAETEPDSGDGDKGQDAN
jgi:hypothetical protein